LENCNVNTAVRGFRSEPTSDGARRLKVGVHEKPNLPEAFHERRTREFGAESGVPPPFLINKIEFRIGASCVRYNYLIIDLFVFGMFCQSMLILLLTMLLSNH